MSDALNTCWGDAFVRVGISQLPGRVGSALSSVKSRVTGAFAGAGSWLASAGSRIINGLISGIRSGFGQVRSLLSSLTSMLPSWKGPPAVDQEILRKSGQLVMKGFESGLTSQMGSVQRTLSGLTSGLPAFTIGAVRGGDGASATNMGGVTININVSGVTGREAGEEAAEAVLAKLAAASLAR